MGRRSARASGGSISTRRAGATSSRKTVWAALTGGERVMHVEWVADPGSDARAIRLRPEEYRRLWAAIRAGFMLDRAGRPQRIDHPGYGPHDAFYVGGGQDQRDQDLQQLGRRPPAACRGQDRRLVARSPKG